MLSLRVRDNLEHCILPFWKDKKDPEYGGYYGLLDFDLNLDKKAVKGCILNSRILWFFSSYYGMTQDEEILPYAEWAYRFFKEACYDKEYGGVYWSMTYNGEISDGTKHTYNLAFAVYALSAYYRVTGREEALTYALRLFGTIETKCRLGDGYGESYTRVFVPNENEKLSENNVIAEKTMNTLLHVLEANTELDRVSGERRVRDRLMWAANEFYDTVYHPDRHRLEVFFDAGMHSLIDLHSYGHDIEAAWRLDQALEVLKDEALTAKLAPMIMDLTEEILRIAIDDGALMAECENGVNLTTRIWWVQCEGIVGFYHAWEKTGEERYLAAAEAVWEYIEKYLIDGRPGSEWLSEVDANGLPESRKPIIEPWKCPYHNGRMCMEIIRRTQRRKIP